MSYILDALKKAEHERRVGQVPSLDGAAVMAYPEKGRSRWPLLVGAVLLVNAVAIAIFVFWLGPATVETPNLPANVEIPPTTSGAESVEIETDVIQDESAPPTPRMNEPMKTVATLPPQPAAETLAGEREPDPSTRMKPRPVPSPPEESARLVEAPPPPSQEPAFKIRKPRALPPLMANLPDNVRSGIPNLELSVHVFSDEPGQSFVFINDRRYEEGATLREGPRLESIEKQGVILNHRGTQFLLPGRW